MATCMSKVDDLLLVLSDGGWHDLPEVEHTLKIDHKELLRIVELLAEFNFITFNGRRIRIDVNTKNLLGPIDSYLKKK
jgi:hypothetical protein